MPTRTIYVPDSEIPVWDAATALAKSHRMSISKLIVDDLRRTVRTYRGDTGVPLGVPVPESMQDPADVRLAQVAERIRLIVLEELTVLEES